MKTGPTIAWGLFVEAAVTRDGGIEPQWQLIAAIWVFKPKAHYRSTAGINKCI